jgi:Acyl-coenzyme A:6-aminopenicillanic acid acyl-transferase
MKTKNESIYLKVFYLIFVLTIILYKCSKDENNTDDTDGTSIWLPQTEEINGILSTESGLPILKIWGTNYEQGYAQGYILAEQIVNLFNDLLTDPTMNISAEDWDNALNHIQMFSIPLDYTSEMQGIIDGINARTVNNEIYIENLGRNLSLNDIIASNCGITEIGCSSFSAWGNLTEDGNTITGRNMDFDKIPAFLSSQLIVIRTPDENENKKAWISICWPCDIGCTTGMNEDGVTVSQQDVYSPTLSVQNGFTPDNFIHRLIIENADSTNVENIVTETLQNNYSILGCAPLISWPHYNNNISALIPEFDGNINDNDSFNIRFPQTEDNYIIGANHFRLRAEPMNDCFRYNIIEELISDIMTGDEQKLSVSSSYNLLKQTPIPEMICMHSVVFEPNKKLMHIALTDGTNHAADCEFVTLNLNNLLEINN